METREAVDADLADWVRLRAALWPGHSSDSLRAEAEQILASKNEACFVLVDDMGSAIGFAEVALYSGSEGPYAHLEGWYVAPGHRRLGHGKELVGSVEQWCLHRTIRLLTSDTVPEYPLSPAALDRVGFKKLHEFTIFAKELPTPG